MKYDGVVINLDDLYLFILNPDTDEIMDGINISYHDCYKDLKNNQLMVVNVVFKDGTQEIDKIDLEDFIYNNNGKHDIFLYIHDILLFSIKHEEYKNLTLKELIDKGDLNNIAKECIANSKIKN